MMGTGAKCKKAVFLDRDGTINNDNGYVYQIEEFEILPGVIEGIFYRMQGIF